MSALRPIPTFLFGSETPETLPRRTPGETPIPLWWATEVDAWETDKVDPTGRRYRAHRWVRHADDGSELARIDVYEDVWPDGRRTLGPEIGFASEAEADVTDPDDVRELAGVLEAAASLLYAIADGGVEGVAR
ncbi:hypothetical protein [Jiangella rhizosphaerae]|uniref:Uncharacterized protein n=1 Tax=Jiangella rhizosphaerae TaxID=2293569 RepID=A0A418KPH4_9ACTN|nr:hypothetical protein [Jiangella rhizosphaerae]RIQ21273.1 hypothetical protein DY240_15740 [Jiangella rhizosphaerae]